MYFVNILIYSPGATSWRFIMGYGYSLEVPHNLLMLYIWLHVRNVKLSMLERLTRNVPIAWIIINVTLCIFLICLPMFQNISILLDIPRMHAKVLHLYFNNVPSSFPHYFIYIFLTSDLTLGQFFSIIFVCVPSFYSDQSALSDLTLLQLLEPLIASCHQFGVQSDRMRRRVWVFDGCLCFYRRCCSVAHFSVNMTVITDVLSFKIAFFLWDCIL